MGSSTGWWSRVASLGAVAMMGCGGGPGDATVSPIEVSSEDTATLDTPTAARADSRPGADAATGGAIWVEDAAGLVAGVLVRRGSDDNIAGRAIYDLVTVYHPDSGLFYEVTMTDGRVRYPHNTLFQGYDCDVPIGLSVGSCTECRSGYGIGILHRGRWWRVRGGVTYEQLAPGSTRGSGLSEECVAHGTSNAKAYPIDPVTGPTPPLAFTPPLRFVWR